MPVCVCRTLLKRMAPEHKFATSARLCSEVLSGFADGLLSLDSASEVLRDALHILASKDVKVDAPRALCPHQICIHHCFRRTCTSLVWQEPTMAMQDLI